MLIFKYIPTFIFTASILVLWQLVVQVGIVSSYILPSPFTMATSLINNFDVITVHVWQTFLETIIGLSIAIILGLVIAIILDTSVWIRKAVYPLLVTSQTIPMIALAPLLLIWFGFGLLPKVIIVVLSCFFPIIVATVDGFAHVDTDFAKLLKSMNASYWQSLWIVRFPASLPQFFSGVKIATTYSVTAAIVGEYVGAYQGLGIYMQEMAHVHAIAVVFAVILVTAVLTIALFLFVVIIERIMIPWHTLSGE